MRVTHLIGSLEAGGAEMTLTRLVLGSTFLETEATHSVLTSVTNGRLGDVLQQRGVALEAVGNGRSRVARQVNAMTSLARSRPDVVQAWMQHSCVVAAVIGRLLRIPVIWTLRMSADRHGMSRLAWILTRLMCGPMQWMPHTIVACSDEVKASHQSLGLRRDVVVIENGVEVEKPTDAQRTSARTEFQIPPAAFVIGRAARWDPAKDFSTLLDAAAIVIDAEPRAIFLLVGRGVDGTNRELTAQLQARGLEGNVLLSGEQTDMARFYAACDVVCSSSSTEGFPNTILEALAAGVPVVATDVGASARILGRTGWLVPPRNPHALGAALLSAVSTPSDALAERGNRGRARVEQEFSIRRMVLAYEEIYRALACLS